MVLTIVHLINHLAFKILEFKSPMDTLLTLYPNIHTTIGAPTHQIIKPLVLMYGKDLKLVVILNCMSSIQEHEILVGNIASVI